MDIEHFYSIVFFCKNDFQIANKHTSYISHFTTRIIFFIVNSQICGIFEMCIVEWILVRTELNCLTEINEYNNEILERRAMNNFSNQHDANFASTNQSKSTKTE